MLKKILRILFITSGIIIFLCIICMIFLRIMTYQFEQRKKPEKPPKLKYDIDTYKAKENTIFFCYKRFL